MRDLWRLLGILFGSAVLYGILDRADKANPLLQTGFQGVQGLLVVAQGRSPREVL